MLLSFSGFTMGSGITRQPASAFISYSRADGEETAARLHDRITRGHPEIFLWQDRSRMYGGVGWWQQIEEALKRVSFLIMVMTPSALVSETTRKEWRYARQQGVCVFPVKGVPDSEIDWEALPKWMSTAHFYDLDTEWETFILHLKSPCLRNRVPFMAPDLPAHFVPRPAEFEALLGRVLDEARQDPIAVTTSLQGAGGFGKTTLAKALCHDDRVVTAFVDGVLWVTLGETPDVRRELTRLHRALTGEQREFLDVEEAAQQLAQVLEEKHCLLVVDDVWSRAHLEPFLRGGRHCTRLITTRRLDIVADLQAPVKVDEMRDEEATRLLVARIGGSTADEGALSRLAGELGAWPILLVLAGSVIQSRLGRGEPLHKVLDYVNRAFEKKGITAFDRSDAGSRNDAVGRTIGVSLDALTGEHRRRCIELAVFPEDAEIPLRTIAALWGTDDFETEQCAERLSDLALIELDLGRAVVQIHDVIRRFFVSRLGDAAAVHARLVAGWGDPGALTDRYALGRLCYHMAQAGQARQLRGLLLDYRWLCHKLESAGANALLEDFRFGGGDPPVQEVERALRQSAHLLAAADGGWRGPAQLASQILARVSGSVDASIAQLRSAAAEAHAAEAPPRLRPLETSLRESPALIRTLSGHRAPVGSLTMLADGRIASGSWDRNIRIWNIVTCQTETVLEGDRGPVFAMIQLRNGRLASAQAGIIRIWNLETHRAEAVLKKHRGSVFALALLPDGGFASASGDGTVRLWNPDGSERGPALKGHEGSVFALAARPDGRLASGGGGGVIHLWNAQTGVLETSLRGHRGAVLALEFLAGGRLASGAADKTIRLWNLESGATDAVLEGNRGRIYALHEMPDGRLASGSSDRTVRVWNLHTCECESVLSGHGDWVKSVIALPGGHLASASDDRTVKLWRPDAAGTDEPVAGHRDWVKALALLPDGRIASGSTDSTIKIWNTGTRAVETTLSRPGESANALAVVSGSRIASAGSRDRTVKVWDLSTGQVEKILTGHSRPAYAVAMLPDGRLASGAGDGTVRLWNAGLTGVDCVLQGHKGSVYALLALPDGRLASASADRTIRIWNVRSGRLEATLAGHTSWVLALALLPGGELVSASRDGTIRLWDPSTCAALAALEEHADWVRALAPLGDMGLASGSDDRTVRLWSRRDGRWQSKVAFVADSGIKSLAFSSERRVLIAGDASGRVHFLELTA